MTESSPAGPGAPAIDPRVGRMLQDRYRILAPIAQGAMGTVYRAERLALGRPVAIKFLHAQLANEPLLVKRFEVEARAMSLLSHPNCVSVIDFGVDELPYLVMDLLKGQSVRQLIDQGPVPAPRALRIARQVLAALAHAHAHGIIHRDIKPENVIIEAVEGLEDHVRVLDFGLAKFMGSQLKLTVGMTLGTPNYMAPELTREGPIDERVDLYATGVVLFEMLAGRPPFQAPDLGEVFLRLLTMPPPPLREMSPHAGFSAELEAAVLRSMAKQADERFPSASAMAAALEAVPEAQTQPPPLQPRPNAPSDTILEPAEELLPAEVSALMKPPRPPNLPGRRASPRTFAVRRTSEAVGRRALALANSFVRTVRPVALQAWTRIQGWRVWLAASRKRSASAGAIAIVAVAGLTLAIVVSRPTADNGTPPEDATAGVGPPAPPPTAGTSRNGAEKELLGLTPEEREHAIEQLIEFRRAEPSNADHPAALARLYFEKRWWAAGLEAARSAGRLDSTYKSDPVLIRHVISALQSDKAGDQAAQHLHALGANARPALREAARSHPNPRVRTRAAEILQPPSAQPIFGGGFGRR
jgi:serine/threonine-protein kinase